MVNRRFKEVVLLVEKEELSCVSSILCVSNERLNEIIEDDKNEGKIPLPDEISKNAFSLLCHYYGYGIIDIDEENVCDLLLCCTCLNEVKLIDICSNYILYHLNSRLVIDILNLFNILPENYLNCLKSGICDYIVLKCISLFNDKDIFKLITLDDIKFIITLDNILIPSEKFLLEKILEHYHQNIERIDNNEDKVNKYNDVMKYLNWKDINFHEIDENDLEIIDMNIMKKSKINNLIKRKYGRIPNTKNEKLNEVILNGMKDVDSIKDMFYEDCEYLLSFKYIFNEIRDYLIKSEYVIEMLTIVRIINKLNIKTNIRIEDDVKMERIKFLLKKYEDENNEDQKSLIAECLSYFLDNKQIIEMVYRWVGNEIIIELLNYRNLENKSMIVGYVKTCVNEATRKIILSKIKDGEIIKEFKEIILYSYYNSDLFNRIISSSNIKVEIELNYSISFCSVIYNGRIEDVMLDGDLQSISNCVRYNPSSNEINIGSYFELNSNPDELVKYPLRLVGLNYSDRIVQNEISTSQTEIIYDNGIPRYKIKFNNRTVYKSPNEVLTEILKYIKRKIDLKLDNGSQEKVRVVMSVPIYLNNRQKQEVVNCANKVDLIVEKLIPIPISICASYYLDRNVLSDKTEKYLICELSPSQLHISIVEMNYQNKITRVLSSEDIGIGSDMFINKLVEYFLEKYREKKNVSMTNQKKILSLRKECINIAKILDGEYNGECYCDCSFLEDIDVDCSIYVADFEHICRDLMNVIEECIISLLKRCKLSQNDINRILLKNDSVKFIKNNLKKRFQIEVEEIRRINSFRIE